MDQPAAAEIVNLHKTFKTGLGKPVVHAVRGVVDAQGTLHEQPAFRVPVIDTTGAGDAFAAALAVHWALGIPRAMRLACAVAALAVRGFGSQSTLPTQRELQDFLERAGA